MSALVECLLSSLLQDEHKLNLDYNRFLQTHRNMDHFVQKNLKEAPSKENQIQLLMAIVAFPYSTTLYEMLINPVSPELNIPACPR